MYFQERLQKFLIHFIFQLLIFQERLSMSKKNNWLQKFHHVAQSKERKKEKGERKKEFSSTRKLNEKISRTHFSPNY